VLPRGVHERKGGGRKRGKVGGSSYGGRRGAAAYRYGALFQPTSITLAEGEGPEGRMTTKLLIKIMRGRNLPRDSVRGSAISSQRKGWCGKQAHRNQERSCAPTTRPHLTATPKQGRKKERPSVLIAKLFGTSSRVQGGGQKVILTS